MKDDAMTSYARKGDEVVFDTEGRPQVGDVVALQIPGQGLMVRRYGGFSEAGRYLATADGNTGAVTEAPCNIRLWGVCGTVARKRRAHGEGSIFNLPTQ
jgi:SOS-response transcriptional repressor LexA